MIMSARGGSRNSGRGVDHGIGKLHAVLGSRSFKGGGASPKVSTSSDTKKINKGIATFMLLDPPRLMKSEYSCTCAVGEGGGGPDPPGSGPNCAM